MFYNYVVSEIVIILKILLKLHSDETKNLELLLFSSILKKFFYYEIISVLIFSVILYLFTTSKLYQQSCIYS